jgi:hypothetical protein
MTPPREEPGSLFRLRAGIRGAHRIECASECCRPLSFVTGRAAACRNHAMEFTDAEATFASYSLGS